jgi:hypothetical protein
MKGEAQADVDRILRENRRVVDEALRRGVRRAMLRHKNQGWSVVVEHDGKIEWLSPRTSFFSVFPRTGVGCNRVQGATASLALTATAAM